jgi:two-component system response regulator FixJ
MISPPIFIIDDDAAVRHSLTRLLRGEGMTARGFACGRSFFELLPEDPAACVITDIRMPDLNGAEVVRRVAELRGDAWPVIVITGHADVPLAVQLMKAGIVDFIEKPFDPYRLVEIVKSCVMRLDQTSSQRQARAKVAQRMAQLTARELQVFQALTDGKSNKEIAIDLDISPRTVEIFRARIMAKMQAESFSALIRMAFQAAA